MKKFNIRGVLWTFIRLSPKNDIIFWRSFTSRTKALCVLLQVKLSVSAVSRLTPLSKNCMVQLKHIARETAICGKPHNSQTEIPALLDGWVTSTPSV
jgi:hypothetical protein